MKPPEAVQSSDSVQTPLAHLEFLPLSKVYTSPHQMRRHFDETALKELAQSMKHEGLLQPITVRPVGSAYELVAGERRMRAALMLGWETIEARVLSLNDEDAAVKGLIENLQRADLNPIEEARSYRQLLQPPYQLAVEAIAERVGRSEAAIAKALALLELPVEMQELVAQARLTSGQLQALKKVTDRGAQILLAKKAAAAEWTVKETEVLVTGWLKANGLPTERRQNDRRTQKADPLADVWNGARQQSGRASSLQWNVHYQGGGRWRFEIKAGEASPHKDLKKCFLQLSSSLDTNAKSAVPSKKKR
jgi:ParB/RepB/Spo0J family partition protein